MTEATFNWRMVKNICAELHVYDEVISGFSFAFLNLVPSPHCADVMLCVSACFSVLLPCPCLCCLHNGQKRRRMPAAISAPTERWPLLCRRLWGTASGRTGPSGMQL